MAEGLKMAGYSTARQQNVQRKTNVERFKSAFGVPPVVYAEIWDELQTSNSAEVRVDTTKAAVNLFNFLHAIHFIKEYPTEDNRAGKAGRCNTYVRDWGWYFLERVAALRAKKVCVAVLFARRLCKNQLNLLLTHSLFRFIPLLDCVAR